MQKIEQRANLPMRRFEMPNRLSAERFRKNSFAIELAGASG
jgi:hypothetical protein